MVTNVTSLTGNGLKDWLIQRVSAIYLAVYTLGLLSYLRLHPALHYEQWQALFQLKSVQIMSMMALFLLLLHAWIGMWTITTDYIKNTAVRVSVQVLLGLFLGGQLLWGFMIVWGQY